MKSKVGRPAHVATEESRTLVESLSGFGIPQDEIARLIGIDPKTGNVQAAASRPSTGVLAF